MKPSQEKNGWFKPNGKITIAVSWCFQCQWIQHTLKSRFQNDWATHSLDIHWRFIRWKTSLPHRENTTAVVPSKTKPYLRGHSPWIPQRFNIIKPILQRSSDPQPSVPPSRWGPPPPLSIPWATPLRRHATTAGRSVSAAGAPGEIPQFEQGFSKDLFQGVVRWFMVVNSRTRIKDALAMILDRFLLEGQDWEIQNKVLFVVRNSGR